MRETSFHGMRLPSASTTVTSLKSQVIVTRDLPAWMFSGRMLRTESITILLASLAAMRFSTSLFKGPA